MKTFFTIAVSLLAALILSGCFTTKEKLPSEDLEVFEQYADLIKVIKDPKLPSNTEKKYQAVKELISEVDLHYTRETSTVDKLFHFRDATIDGLDTETPTFTFLYQFKNKFVRIRFFTCRMFITRVEIKENE